jgi:hypothetical protein
MPTRNSSSSTSLQSEVGRIPKGARALEGAFKAEEIVSKLKKGVGLEKKGDIDNTQLNGYVSQGANTAVYQAVERAMSGAYAEKLKKEFGVDDKYIETLKGGVKNVLREKINGLLRANEKISPTGDNFDKNKAIFQVTSNDRTLFKSFSAAETLEEANFFRFERAERSVDGGKNQDAIMVNPDSFEAKLYPKGRAFLKAAGLLDLWNAKF